MAKVLVVDDEESIVWAFQKLLESLGHAVLSSATAERALEIARAEHPDLVIVDVKLPGVSGLWAVEEIRREVPGTKVIVITAHGTLDTAVQAYKLGAEEYLPKPLDLNVARERIEEVLKGVAPSAEVQTLRGARAKPGEIVGRSLAMQEVFKKVAAVATSETTVLLMGESGTGKELIARAIHYNGPRSTGPFEAINCAAIPEALLESELYGHEEGAFTGAVRQKLGKFEIAHGGTLFLDEIGDLPAAAQVKLLRFLELRTFERVGGTKTLTVDARVISATNQDLEDRVRKGRFREDLYFRLNVVKIEVPPLRARHEDIAILVAHFLDQTDAAGISNGALALLRAHSWPGNVRELRNAIERGVVLARGGAVRPEHLPEEICRPVGSGGRDFESRVRELVAEIATGAREGEIYRVVEEHWEKAVLRQILEAARGNQLRAAELLGINRITLRRKKDQYGL